MKEWFLARLKKVTNNQLSNMVLIAVFATIGLTMFGPMAKALAFVAIAFSCANISHDIARAIDWMDDNVSYKFEIPWRYHLVYAFGLAIISGALVGVVGPAIFPFSPDLYVFISPKVAFFLFGFVCSLVGYWIAWQNIPNHKGRR